MSVSVGLLCAILFGSLIILLLAGIPVAFCMSTISLVLGYFFWGGSASFFGYVASLFTSMQSSIYMAIPMYIMMAAILRYSNLADDLYDCMYKWFGKVRGGLAVGSVIICALFAAMVGLTSVATATLGATALPSMEKRGYSQKFSAGVIMGGACLGIIIPPSVVMLVYAAVAEVSPGKMFIAGIVPGLIIAVFIIIYSLIYARIYPQNAPALPEEEKFTRKEKLLALRAIILPVLIIICVIVSILTGIATPTEAGAVGVVGSFICALIKRSVNKESAKNMFKMAVNLSGSIFYLIVGALAYARIASAANIGKILSSWLLANNFGVYTVILIISIFFIIIGMFMDAGAGLFMTAPIIVPVLNAMGFDLIVFGLVYTLLVCIGNLTPPFGICLFVMRGAAPHVSMGTIYKSSIPHIAIYLGSIIFFLLFPKLVTWLPSLMMG